MNAFARLVNGISPIQWKTPLSAAAWAALAAVPVCIVLLYFLKLRRHQVIVPSTLLWRRSMEDLRVNSLFQRLRRNILLLMQLLTVFLILAALAGPSLSGSRSQGRRLILAIDNSASMSSSDVSPDRLSAAKTRATNLIDTLASNDLAMIIAFSDSAEVMASYTSNKSLLKRKVSEIAATDRRSDPLEALRVADGLANPSRQAEGGVASEETTPKLVIFTDGGFADIQGFSLGNLEPELVIIGQGPPPFRAGQDEEKTDYPTKNQGILALQSRRNEDTPGTIEIFGRYRNYDAADANADLKLYRIPLDSAGGGRTLADAIKFTVPGQSEKGFQFSIADNGPQAFVLESTSTDDLRADDVAYVVIPPGKKPGVRLVTAGNRYLSQFFRSPAMTEAIRFSEITPEDLKKPEILQGFELGTDSLTIFDGCAPEKSPQNSTMYFGAFPPGEKFKDLKPVENPTVLDIDTSNPLMQYVRDLTLVRIRSARIPEPLPAGIRPLIESDRGPLAFVSPREGFSDVVVGFGLVTTKEFETDWFLKYSFPIFLNNCVTHLAGTGADQDASSRPPGDNFFVTTAGLAGKTVTIRSLSDSALPRSTAAVDSTGRLPLTASSRQGAFGVYEGDSLVDLFAVNLFSQRESDLSVRGLSPTDAPPAVAEKFGLKIGYTPLTGKSKPESETSPLWKLAVAAGLAMLMAEWFIYNRRVAV
jgi:hypothetical protein